MSTRKARLGECIFWSCTAAILAFLLVAGSSWIAHGADRPVIGALIQKQNVDVCMHDKDFADLVEADKAGMLRYLWSRKVKERLCGSFDAPSRIVSVLDSYEDGKGVKTYVLAIDVYVGGHWFPFRALTSMEPQGYWSIRDPEGKYVNSPLKEWFDSLHSKKGSCCTDFDGKPPEAVVQTKKGSWQVMLDGKWWDVPEDALITVPNLFGQPVVWFYWQMQGDGSRIPVIRCFMGGTLT